MESRTKNTKRNIVFGFLAKFIIILLPFINRTVFIRFFDISFLGLNSLFSALLSVLSLAELGFSTAIIYEMYEPLAHDNKQLVCALLNYFKKIYKVVGFTISSIGLLLLPVLKYLIHGNYPDNLNIYIIFLIYLFNTSISYFFFGYKSSIITAFQRTDLLSVISVISSTIQSVLQLSAIILFKSYYVYVFLTPIGTILQNILINIVSKKKFSEYKEFGDIQVEQKREIKKRVLGLLVDKLGDVSRNSFDNIVISSFYGLSVLAIYNNYYYINTSLCGIMLIIKNSMQASIGNSIALESPLKNYNDLLKFNFIFCWLIGCCGICMLCLYQPFIDLWIGSEYKLSNFNMCLFPLYFYCFNMNDISNLYYQGSGLWWYGKISCIVESVGNLILNILLGRLIGIPGVTIATILTLIFTNFFWRTSILFKHYFKFSASSFYLENLLYFIVTFVVALITYKFCQLITCIGFIKFALNTVICIFVPNIFYFVIYLNNKHFKEALAFSIFRRK